MHLKINDIGGVVVKDNETYKLKDNTLLNNLVVSSTDLKPYQSTNGHTHPGQEEVYYFVKGAGIETLPTAIFGSVKQGLKPNIMAISTMLLGLSIVMVTISYFVSKSDNTK